MKQKINLAIMILFAALLLGFGVAFWAVPDEDFSASENRALQGFPTLSLEGWLDGSVSGKLTEYYSDQFPLRAAWVALHAIGELGSGRGESNGVLLGEGGQLAVRRFDAYVSLTERWEDTDYTVESHIDAGLEAILQLNKTLSDKDIPLCVLLAPRTIDVTISDFSYPSTLSDELDTKIQATLAGINSVELLADLRARHEAGEYVYYRTDHHWTTAGAYTAYVAVMESWRMEADILPAETFTIRTVEDFYGTTYSRAGIFTVAPDTLEIWEAPDDADYTVRDADGRVVIEGGFISEKYLSEKDKYGAFLDGTHRLLTITNDKAAAEGVDRPRLLLARDSFANSMVPFLSRHFDIVMVNLSGGMTDLSALAAEYDCDRVLVVCNRENLVTSDCFVRMK